MGKMEGGREGEGWKREERNQIGNEKEKEGNQMGIRKRFGKETWWGRGRKKNKIKNKNENRKESIKETKIIKLYI